MFKKLFIIITLTIINNSYCLAHDTLRITPILKKYPTPQEISLYPLENKITPNLIISTPYPKGIAPVVPLYMYDEVKHKLISFSWEDRELDIKLFKNAFGLEQTVNSKEASDFRRGLISNKEVFQIKLNRPIYKVFTVISHKKNIYKYNLYIFSTNENIVRMLTINNFPQKEAEGILGTIRVIGENNK